MHVRGCLSSQLCDKGPAAQGPQQPSATDRVERRLGARRPRMLPYRACSIAARVTAASAPSPRLLAPPCTGLLRKGFASRSSPPPSPSDPASTTAALGRRRWSRRAPSLLHHGPSSPGARAMSSYEWKNMSKYAQRANKEFATLTKKEIRKVGEEEVDKVEKALKAMEPFNDVFTVRREGLEVFAELGPLVGTYWIKFDLSIHQICMMSPRSGPHRYIYDTESSRWIGEADKHDFQGMLTRDIIQSACGIPEF